MYHDFKFLKYTHLWTYDPWCNDDSILLWPALEWIKGNRSVWALRKVNLIITYRFELDPEKQTIIQELCGQNTPRGLSVEKIMMKVKERKVKCTYIKISFAFIYAYYLIVLWLAMIMIISFYYLLSVWLKWNLL